MEYPLGFPESAEVVIVDDEEQNLYIFKDEFSEDFLNIKSFTDPELAYLYVVSHPRVLLVIADQAMPKKTGLELGKAIKEICPHIHLIMITANPKADKDLMYNSLKQNIFFDFIQKPVNYNKDKDKLRFLFVEATILAFKRYCQVDYTRASELFSTTPITEAEHEQIAKLIRSNLSKNITTDNTFTKVFMFKEINGVKTPVATIEKLENGGWSLSVNSSPSTPLNDNVPKQYTATRELADLFNLLLNHHSFANEKKLLVA